MNLKKIGKRLLILTVLVIVISQFVDVGGYGLLVFETFGLIGALVLISIGDISHMD